MQCDEALALLGAKVDGALDPAQEARLDAHLIGCPGCAASLRLEAATHALLTSELGAMRAPSGLRESVHHEVMVAARPARSSTARTWWVGLAAALLVGGGIGWQMASRVAASHAMDQLDEAVVSAHLRSLQAEHLTDVASSEHHTVRPWFTGKLDFAPPVPDLAAHDFLLVGGRLDQLGDRPVAALVYRHGAHLINLFLWPSTETHATRSATTMRGFALERGISGGVTFEIISDLNPVELRAFAELVRSALTVP